MTLCTSSVTELVVLRAATESGCDTGTEIPKYLCSFTLSGSTSVPIRDIFSQPITKHFNGLTDRPKPSNAS
ncbi:hypothetical protein ADUPG1_004128, partial [Aduncisulcus paluster]